MSGRWSGWLPLPDRIDARGRALMRFASIDDAALAGANHFHQIRLVAAVLVLIAHSFHLLDRAGDEPIGRWFQTVDASRLGVMMFFFISGFLVARSWDLRRDLASFAVARALRIAPALWLALLVTVFVVGPAFTTLPASTYVADARTWQYLALNALMLPQYVLPGVFEANPLPGVNGSLWTIPLEVVMYGVLGVGGWLGLVARDPWPALRARFAAPRWIAIVLLAVAIGLIAKVLWTGPQYSVLAGYFLLGALAYRLRHSLRLSVPAAALLVAATIALAPVGLTTWLLPLSLPYALLVIALHPALSSRTTWLHRHDYSYGTYLYGFPVQQALIALGVKSPFFLLGLSLPLTWGLAALSWHLVERPALASKQRWSASIGAWLAQWRTGH